MTHYMLLSSHKPVDKSPTLIEEDNIPNDVKECLNAVKKKDHWKVATDPMTVINELTKLGFECIGKTGTLVCTVWTVGRSESGKGQKDVNVPCKSYPKGYLMEKEGLSDFKDKFDDDSPSDDSEDELETTRDVLKAFLAGGGCSSIKSISVETEKELKLLNGSEKPKELVAYNK